MLPYWFVAKILQRFVTKVCLSNSNIESYREIMVCSKCGFTLQYSFLKI